MLSERARKCFADIKVAIELINNWASQAGGAEDAIRHDSLVRSAIERQLLVISESATRLDKLDPAIAPTLAPQIDWPGIRGIGNFIRHKYDDLDTQIIIDVLNKRLDALEAACDLALTNST